MQEKNLYTLKDIKIEFEERFHKKWTSLSVQYQFKSIASSLMSISFSEVNLCQGLEVSDEKRKEFSSVFAELETDKPLQYILGDTVFRDCEILCSPAALIPRPETEELVDLVLNELSRRSNPEMLDLCTGTGCIAISVKQENPSVSIIAIDKFQEVIDLAKLNKEHNEVSLDIEMVDVLSKEEMYRFETNRFDVWVSNPPYIPERDKVIMEKNVLDYEPGAALFVPDNDPLLFYREIAKSALKGLKQGGVLFYEIHEDFAKETIDLLTELNFDNITLHQDLQGKSRMTSATKK